MATIGRLAHRPAMTIACLSTVVLGLGGCLTAGVAASDVSWYRYVLELRSGDLRYVEPLGPAVVEGRRYRVETDGRGRITRAVTFIGARRWPRSPTTSTGSAMGQGYDPGTPTASRPRASGFTVTSRDGGRARMFFLLDADDRVSPAHVRGVTSRACVTPGREARESRDALLFAEGRVDAVALVPRGRVDVLRCRVRRADRLSKDAIKYRQGVLGPRPGDLRQRGLPARSIHPTREAASSGSPSSPRD